MGVLSKFLGGGASTAIDSVANAVTSVAGAFRPNAESDASRRHESMIAAQSQYAAEFTRRTNWFDSIIDGINRLPRPIIALGTIYLFALSVYNPISFSAAMTSMQLVPDALWWIFGAIVGFYFGARELQNFRNTKIKIENVKQVTEQIKQIERLRPPKISKTVPAVLPAGQITEDDDDDETEKVSASDNPALDLLLN